MAAPRCPHCKKIVSNTAGAVRSHIAQTPVCRRKRKMALRKSSTRQVQQPGEDLDTESTLDDDDEDLGNVEPEGASGLNTHVVWELSLDELSDRDVQPTRPESDNNSNRPGYIIHTTPGAAHVLSDVPQQTRWEAIRNTEDPEYPFHPWASRKEFEFVEALSSGNISQKAIDRILQTKLVSETNLSFSTAKDMNERIRDRMEEGPTWKAKLVSLPEAPLEPQILFYRDPKECAQYLLGNPTFEGSMGYEALEVFEADGKTRVYHEMYTGKLWNEVQADLPTGMTIAAAILASDKTHLTNFSGNKHMHPVYMTLGNINKDVRSKTSRRAYVTLAYLPVTRFSRTEVPAETDQKRTDLRNLLTRVLFHECMAIVLYPLLDRTPQIMVDSEGFRREVIVHLMAYIADLEEQWLISGLKKNQCPNCLAGYHQLEDATPCEHRTSESILFDISRVRVHMPTANLWQFAHLASSLGLCGIEHPFWEKHTSVNICRIICQDLLHGLHKGFTDHTLEWISNTIGVAELDRRFRAQPRRTGTRTFPSGISHVSQWSGKEHRDIEHLILPVINGAEGATNSVLLAVRAQIEFIAMAQFPLHTDTSLAQMRNHLHDFHANKHVFISNESRRGKNGPIEHMKIPKVHSPHHYSTNIEDLGTADNYSTETSETMHISSCKNPYKASSRKRYMVQVLNALTRNENLHMYSSYLRWRENYWEEASDDSGTGDSEGYNDMDSLKNIMLSQRPHLSHIPIQSLAVSRSLPSLLSAVARYFIGDDSGLSRRPRYYADNEVPPQFKIIDVWNSFRLHIPSSNEFFPDQTTTIHCKLATESDPALYDPVLVQVKESIDGEELSLQGRLRLVFRSATSRLKRNNDLYAYVEWFTHIPRTSPLPAKMRRIDKEIWAGGERASGVIKLSRIKGICPLSPVIHGQCDPSLNDSTSYDHFPSFWINQFASLQDYIRLS